MIIICAVDKNFGVGKDGKIPWKNQKDLKHFKEYTLGKTLLVGRKTQLPPLKDRTVIVLERDSTTRSNLCHPSNYNHVLIGGPTVWKEALKCNYVTEIIMTFIDEEYECDTFFPKEYLKGFIQTESFNLDGKTKVVKFYKN